MKFSDQLAFLKRNHSLQNELSVESLDNNIYPIHNSKNKNISDVKSLKKISGFVENFCIKKFKPKNKKDIFLFFHFSIEIV